jgi:uncharacterized membrane protein YtjA (UPF0391 family)
MDSRLPDRIGIVEVDASANREIGQFRRCARKGTTMLRWALGFFIIAIVAAVFGFGGIAAASAGIAKILFFIFLVMFLVALVGGLTRRA